MRILVSVTDSAVQLDTDVIPLDVFPEMTVNDIKAIVEDEIKVPPLQQHFSYNMRVINDNTQTLTQLGVNEGDMLALQIRDPQDLARRRRAPESSSNQQRLQRPRQGPDPEQFRLQLLGDARVMEEVRRQLPELAQAANDRDRFHAIWDERQRHGEEVRAEKQAQLELLNADPFNLEAQKKIEEMIRQERVQENVQKALEENPESFARVTMLYIHVLVNNVPIKAFVDSGAQTTIMSPDAAERCGIRRLIDQRFGGIAKGVGTAKILGRVHSAEIQIGQYSLNSSFTVMEGKDVDLLLGLDMLKRHQMCIDLRQNCLVVQDDKIEFLAENELPKMYDEMLDEEPKVDGPAGIQIGARTGTVEAPSSSSQAKSAESQASSSKGKINIHPVGSPGNVGSQSAPSTSTASAPSQPLPAPENVYGSPQPITETSIKQVMEMGFTREQALQALSQAHGNVELAMGLLFE